MFPTHKDCINFRDGICMVLGVPVNPNGPACSRFTPRSPMPLVPQGSGEVSLEELKRRIDAAEAKLRVIKSMLERLR